MDKETTKIPIPHDRLRMIRRALGVLACATPVGLEVSTCFTFKVCHEAIETARVENERLWEELKDEGIGARMDKTTPRPWKYQERSDAYTHIVRGPSNQFIVQFSQDTIGKSEANARLIIQAVNNFEPLVQALEAIRDYCIPGMNWTDEIGQALLKQADKALAAAKAEKE